MTIAAETGGKTVFYDAPEDYGGVSYSFHANLSLIGIDKGGKESVLWSTTWGFKVDGAAGTTTLEPLTGKTQ